VLLLRLLLLRSQPGLLLGLLSRTRRHSLHR